MTPIAQDVPAEQAASEPLRTGAREAPMTPGVRTGMIGLIGFLTLVDLFAAQAILPGLALAYGVTAAEIGLAANASTLGMAAAGLLAGVVAGGLPRRAAIAACLALLAVPTALLATHPPLPVFALLRVVQGLFMATAFTLTLAHFSERCSQRDVAIALAAYVTGVVASNLFGRLMATFAAAWIGVVESFLVFAALNLFGAGLALAVLTHRPVTRSPTPTVFWRPWLAHMRIPAPVRGFLIGFAILFAFIGVFTYVGFVLVAPPVAVAPTVLGLVFLSFLPSLLTTPLAGAAVARFGVRRTLPAALGLAAAGTALTALPDLAAILLGLALVAMGTFLAQAVTTGFIGRSSGDEPVAASGLYLSFYYLGGLAGAAVLGPLFMLLGWSAVVACIIAVLIAAAWVGAGLAA